MGDNHSFACAFMSEMHLHVSQGEMHYTPHAPCEITCCVLSQNLLSLFFFIYFYLFKTAVANWRGSFRTSRLLPFLQPSYITGNSVVKGRSRPREHVTGPFPALPLPRKEGGQWLPGPPSSSATFTFTSCVCAKRR